jgi:SAM-dependent methyltransferase
MTTTATPNGAATAAEPWQIRLYRRSIKKKETLEAVLRLLPPVAGKRCLEIGCATGTSSWLLRQRGGEWTSTDFDPKQVDSARQLLGGDVMLIDAGPLPFPDESFDVVVGINFLEHLEDDAGFVREMVRVLRPGGAFLLTCPDGVSNRLGYRLKKLYRFTADTGGFGHARDGYLKHELERLIRDAGLRIELLEALHRARREQPELRLPSLGRQEHRRGGRRPLPRRHLAGQRRRLPVRGLEVPGVRGGLPGAARLLAAGPPDPVPSGLHVLRAGAEARLGLAAPPGREGPLHP